MGFAGKQFGVWSYGVFSTVSCVLIHHIETTMYTRNWARPLITWWVVSIVLLPLTVLAQNFMIASSLYRSIFS